jgi:WD40 repeat protein
MTTESCSRFFACLLGISLAMAEASAAPLLPLPLDSASKKQPKKDSKPVKLTVEEMPGAIVHLGNGQFRHGAAAVGVMFSPDSKQLLSVGQDGALRIWDVESGVPLHKLSIPQNPMRLVRTGDGSKLAIAFTDGHLTLLHPDTLKEMSSFGAAVGTSFALSRDGSILVTNNPDGTLVTDLNTELPLLELPGGSQYAFHPAGKSVAVADLNGKVTLYMLAGGKPLGTFDHGEPLNGLLFSPDGKQVVTGSSVGGDSLKVWEIGKNQLALELKGVSNPRAWITSNRIAAANASGVGVFDLVKKRWVGFAKGVSGDWAVSPDGSKAAAPRTGGYHVHLWDLSTGKLIEREGNAFPEVTLLAPTDDGHAVFVLSSDTALHWPIDKAAASRRGTLPGKALTATINGKRLAVAIQEGVLIYDDFDPAKPLAEKPSRKIVSLAVGCKAVALSPDASAVAYSGENGRIVIASAADGSRIRAFPNPTIALALAFTPDGEKLAALGRDGFLRLMLVKDLYQAEPTSLWSVRVQRSQKAAVAVSPDGRVIAATSSTQLIFIAAKDGTILHAESRLMADDGPFHQLAFSPDGRLLFSGSAGLNGAVQVWEVATGSLVRRYATGFGAISGLGIFPDGSRVVSAGAEEAITLWDTSFRTGKEKPTGEELLNAWTDLALPEGERGYPASRVLVAGGPRGLKIMAVGIQQMLDSQKNGQMDDSPRLVRAIQALEDIGGAEARILLEKLAALSGRSGEDASGALKRMKKG